MGTRMTVPGYVGDMGLGFDPVIRRGLRFLNFFGGSSDKTGRNLAPGGGAGTVLGQPVIMDDGVQFTPAGTLLDTGIVQPESFTVFAVFNCPALSQILLMSNFNGARPSGTGTTQGVTLRTQAGTGNMTLNFSVNTIKDNVSTQRSVAMSGLLPAVNYLICARFSAGERMDLQIINTGRYVEKTSDMQDMPDKGAKLRVGGSYQNDLANAGIHRMFALYDVALSDDEVTKSSSQWAAWASAVGLTL
ncbi:hypothetical protein RFL90_004119 [Klebsiella pneumoniae]|uniref:hypothetical protein n=2 Tax=Klebsiella pneumoniae TaxID=573 RepID=UPI001E35FF65|nr:hypothetical protein [Klebsiella pneumoniae]ELA3332995.1 hypothetical protein [Klebsiella pneumoniae]